MIKKPGSKLSLDAALQVAKLPNDEQQEFAEQGVKAVKEKAAELRKPPPVPLEDRRLGTSKNSRHQGAPVKLETVQAHQNS
jgi:hypothetical protein